MPYCRYCLGDFLAEDMPSPRTCNLCREKQFRAGALKAKKKRSTRRYNERNSVRYYFQRSRIKHAPFPDDIVKLIELFKRAIGINRYKKAFISVDHIIPVNHPLVCGLTVSWNLQLMTRADNISKGNECDLDLASKRLYKWLKAKGL